MEFVAILTRIERNLHALASQHKPEVAYFLDAATPYAQVLYQDGRTFKIRQDGRTTAEVAGLDLPCPCPYPDAIWRLNTAVFVRRHRKHLPLAALALVAMASLQLLIATIPGAPGAAWFLDYFAAVMNTVLITLASLCLVAFALHNFGKGIDVRFGQPDTDTPLLSAGQIDIAPDIHVFSTSESEQPDIFAQRVRDAYTDMLPRGQYLLILTYRCPSGIIVRFPDTGSQEYFERANLIKTIPGWMQEVCPPVRFDRETWADFSAYCVAFCEQFRVWSQTDKMKQGNPVKDLLHAMEAASQKAAVILALLFFPLFASAQSAVPIPQRGDFAPTGGIIDKLPDSMALEQMKIAYMVERAQEWRKVSPVVDFYMWRFEISFLVIFLGIGGILWVFAKVAARDSIKDVYGAPVFGDILTRMHIWSKGVLFLILAAISLVYLSEAIIRYYYTGSIPTLWTLVKWAVICWLWYRVFEFVLPDTPGSKPEHQNRHIGGGNQFPRIG